MLTLITAALGAISTLLAWFLNPRRKLYAEIDSIYKRLEECYDKRDKALQSGDNDTLTIVFADIVKLCQRKAILFQRFG